VTSIHVTCKKLWLLKLDSHPEICSSSAFSFQPQQKGSCLIFLSRCGLFPLHILALLSFHLKVMDWLHFVALGGFVSFVLYYSLTLVIDTSIDLDRVACQYINIVVWWKLLIPTTFKGCVFQHEWWPALKKGSLGWEQTLIFFACQLSLFSCSWLWKG
jgi:hypothetical protein